MPITRQDIRKSPEFKKRVLEKRVKKMKEFILSRKENNIAIVSHSSYLAYFLKGKITDTNNELKHCFPYTMFLKSPTNYI